MTDTHEPQIHNFCFCVDTSQIPYAGFNTTREGVLFSPELLKVT